MGQNSKIEWTTHTFNGWRGCTKVSEGCVHCYAETMSKRFPEKLGVWGDSGTRVIASDSMWREPLKWNRAAASATERQRVFCSSLADVFERRDELDEQRFRLWGLIEQTPWLDWLLLTKRPENILGMIPSYWDEQPRKNVWFGTSVENQTTADARIPWLLKTPAAVRFLSVEPLLGPVDLAKWCERFRKGLACAMYSGVPNFSISMPIDWVIVGGESGPKARPMHPDWARSIRDQCQSAGVAFFFKQWGEWLHNDGKDFERVGKKTAGRELDGRTWDEVPRRKDATPSKNLA